MHGLELHWLSFCNGEDFFSLNSLFKVKAVVVVFKLGEYVLVVGLLAVDVLDVESSVGSGVYCHI